MAKGMIVNPDKYPAEVMTAAYESYLAGNMDYGKMSLELAVPEKVLKRWVEDGGWREKKLELDKQLFEDAENEYRKFLINNRVPVAERHARVSGKLESALEKQLDDVHAAIESGTLEERYPGSTLKRMAEALASVSGVSARAVGLSDRPAILEDGGNKGSGKVPLVTINVTPVVHRHDRDEKVIDVS
jgi:hypothetical protein